MIILEISKQAWTYRRAPGEGGGEKIQDKFGIEIGEIAPRVFWRITEDWLE